MKITMICGSPSPKGSTSEYLIEELKKKLGPGNEIHVIATANHSAQSCAAQVMTTLSDCNALIIAYPLYVDTAPSQLLELLRIVEKENTGKNNRLPVYQVVNNGFYEASQNRIAIDMIWKWCEKCNFVKGRAVGVGAGPMARVAPLGYGPSTSLGKAMDQLTETILQEQSGDTIFVEPNYPRFLYRLQFNLSWIKPAKQNGLRWSDLRRR